MIDSMLMLTILPSKRLHPHGAQDGLINLRLYAFLDEVLVFHVLIKQVQKKNNSDVRQSIALTYFYMYFFLLLVLKKQTILYTKVPYMENSPRECCEA